MTRSNLPPGSQVTVCRHAGEFLTDLDCKLRIQETSSHLADLFVQLRQLNNLINEKAARVDFDVLARICNALDCRIEDILEYVPKDPEEDNSKIKNLEK